MNLILVRHGECETAADGPLTVQGELQAWYTARQLSTEDVTHIITSPLLRALGTASIIAEELKEVPVEVWPDLREGFSFTEEEFEWAERLARFPRVKVPPAFAADRWMYGGDTYESFFARCKHVLSLLKQRFNTEERIVVVAHGGLINYLLHAILNIAPTTPQWFEMAYCAISRVRFIPEAERWQGWPLYPPVETAVLSVNDVAHLTTLA